MSSSRAMHKAIVVFPAIAMVISLGCVSASQADSNQSAIAKKTTTTVKRKKAPSTTRAPKGSSQTSALFVLSGIKQEPERPQGYKRDQFRHWTDDNSNGCNTREEVLIAESSSPAQVDPYGCKVLEGDWFSTYDGVAHTDPSDLDIDHMVALKEAWDSGAWSWSASQRQKFANDLSDPRSLIAVTAGVNRSKGDKDPANWLPPRSEAICTYVSDWVAVKARWKLSMDTSEWGRIKNILTNNCAGTRLAPWGSATSVRSTTPVGTAAPAPTTFPSSSAVTTPNSQAGPLPLVTPGAWCASEGAFGTGNKNGNKYICSKTKVSGEPYADGRARWRPVS